MGKHADSGPSSIRSLIANGKGMAEYVTGSGVRVLLCHYSADPEKSPETWEGQQWLQRAATKGYPGGMDGPKWQQEMEMNFGCRQSIRVWPDWAEEWEKRVTVPSFDINDHPLWPIYAGYDYGSTNPFAVVVVAWENEHSWYLIDELYASNTPLHVQMDMLRRRPYFSRISGFIGDPSIWYKNQNTTQNGQPHFTSMGEIISDQYDINILKGDNSPGSDATFINYLKSVAWKDAEEPQFKIFSHCRHTLRELRLLRYKEWKAEATKDDNNRYESIVNKDNHAWDALKYLLLWRQGESPEEIEAPVGSFDWYRNRLISLKRAQAAILE